MNRTKIHIAREKEFEDKIPAFVITKGLKETAHVANSWLGQDGVLGLEYEVLI